MGHHEPVTTDDTPHERTEPRAAPLLAAPAAALIVLVVAIPLAATALRGATSLGWVLDSQVSTVVNTAVWVVGSTSGAVAGGLGLTLLLHGRRSSPVLRGLLLVPAAASLTVVAVAWRALFAFRPAGRPQVGLVNEVTGVVGLAPVAWLTQEPLVNTVLLAGALAWAASGVVAVVLLAHLRDVPGPVGGARARWAAFRRDVLPVVRRPLVAVTLGVGIVAARTHDIVRVATDGSFGTQVLSTEAIDRALQASQPGRGAALGLVLVLAVVPLVGLLLWSATRDREEVPRGRHSRGRRHRTDDLPTSTRPEDAASSPPRGRRPFGVAGALVVAVMLVPLVGIVLTALRPASDVAADGWWHLVAAPDLSLVNLRTVLSDGTTGGMWAATLDTLAVTVPAVLLTSGLAIVTVDAIDRLRPGAARGARFLLVSAAAVPLAAVLPPLVEALDAVGVQGSPVALWLVHTAVGLPFAALVIGAATSRRRGAWSPERVLVAAAIQFVLIWGDLLVASSVVGGEASGPEPVAVRLASLVASRGEELHLVAAAAVVTLAVPVVVALSVRSSIERVVVGGDHARQVDGTATTS